MVIRVIRSIKVIKVIEFVVVVAIFRDVVLVVTLLERVSFHDDRAKVVIVTLFLITIVLKALATLVMIDNAHAKNSSYSSLYDRGNNIHDDHGNNMHDNCGNNIHDDHGNQ
jgi:hypothetical protein